MNNKLKKLIALGLSMLLVLSAFTACTEDDEKDSEKAYYESEQSAEKDDLIGNAEVRPAKDCWVAKTFAEVTDLLDIDATTFSEGLAFVRVKDHNTYITYVIDRTGEIKFSLGELSLNMEAAGFHNGLSLVDEFSRSFYLIDTEGNEYTAEDFGGTGFYIKESDFGMEMFIGGYFIVDKVTSSFDGATYESAVYNSECQQVQSYSKELYEFIHDDGFSFSQFYDGYIIKNEIETYHIETGTYGEFSDIPLKFKMDFATYISDYDGQGMFRDDKNVLDLSAYETLSYVKYMGDNGFAIFSNENNDCYFSVMDTAGNLKFDPIYYGKSNYCSVDFNESTIITKTFLEQTDGTLLVQIKTYDWSGNELGTLEMSKSARALSFVNVYLGEDSILIKHSENNTIGYYDMNLKPMFPTE